MSQRLHVINKYCMCNVKQRMWFWSLNSVLCEEMQNNDGYTLKVQFCTRIHYYFHSPLTKTCNYLHPLSEIPMSELKDGLLCWRFAVSSFSLTYDVSLYQFVLGSCTRYVPRATLLRALLTSLFSVRIRTYHGTFVCMIIMMSQYCTVVVW
jgi:hypothetical protein